MSNKSPISKPASQNDRERARENLASLIGQFLARYWLREERQQVTPKAATSKLSSVEFHSAAEADAMASRRGAQ